MRIFVILAVKLAASLALMTAISIAAAATPEGNVGITASETVPSPPEMTSTLWVIPTSEQVPLRGRMSIPPDEQEENRKMTAQAYDVARALLMKARIDRLTTARLLSSVTDNGMSDFVSQVDFDAWLSQGSRPSILNQLCWRDDLRRIQEDVIEHYNSEYPKARAKRYPNQLAPFADSPGPDGEYELVIHTSRLNYYRAPWFLSQRARILGEELNGFEFQCTQTAPLLPVRSFRWTVPIRIAATGDDKIDNVIADALAEIKAKVPNAPIDDKSFPAPPEEQNLFYAGQDGEVSVVFDNLMECLHRATCYSIKQMRQVKSALPMRGDASQTRAFLASTYFSSSVDGESSAIVELDARGAIKAAMCGKPAKQGGRKFMIITAKSCLAQAMGAYPRLWDEGLRSFEETELGYWRTGLKQLNKLYRYYVRK